MFICSYDKSDSCCSHFSTQNIFYISSVKRDIFIIFLENDFESDDDFLTAGLSIVFLKFTSFASSLIVVNISKEYTEAHLNSNETYEIRPDIRLPNTHYPGHYDPLGLITTFPQQVEFSFLSLDERFLEYIVSGGERECGENKS